MSKVTFRRSSAYAWIWVLSHHWLQTLWHLSQGDHSFGTGSLCSSPRVIEGFHVCTLWKHFNSSLLTLFSPSHMLTEFVREWENWSALSPSFGYYILSKCNLTRTKCGVYPSNAQENLSGSGNKHSGILCRPDVQTMRWHVGEERKNPSPWNLAYSQDGLLALWRCGRESFCSWLLLAHTFWMIVNFS